MAAAVLAVAMLGGCGAGPELESLQNERFSDLSRTTVASAVHEQSRHETKAGTTMGKPVYAGITVTYTITGDPQAAFDKIRDLAVTDGWALGEPDETIGGTTVLGDKQLNDTLRGKLALTFVPGGRNTLTGEPGPAVITALTALPT